jgi:transposase-like protein
MKAELGNPVFSDEAKAREWLEAHLWPKGPVCPHCGTVGGATLIQGDKRTHRDGLYMCNECRKQFTVTVGTIFERSHIPLNKWLYATYLICASKKGMSSLQLQRMLGLGSYRSAWFMAHRIREAMREGKFTTQLGGEGKTVESDETFIGGREINKHRNKRKHAGTGGVGKEAVFSLVERGGSVRSHHVPSVNAKTLWPILVSQVDRGSFLMTDESAPAKMMGKMFGNHQSINHAIGEYVRGEAHTNTIEGYFSILKRGVIGTYHSISQQHLKRYLAEFDFRYNEREGLGVTDKQRTAKALKGIVGKRLTYRRTGGASAHAKA